LLSNTSFDVYMFSSTGNSTEVLKPVFIWPLAISYY
jgi:hypothetical protein